MSLHKRERIVAAIKAEIDLDRLTELLAQDYMQQAAQELQESINDAERG